MVWADTSRSAARWLVRNLDSHRPARSPLAAWAGRLPGFLCRSRVRYEVAEPGCDHGGDLGVRIGGQLKVVLGSAQVSVAHVGRQVRQHDHQVRAAGGPAAQVRHGEAVPQRMDVRAAGEMRDVGVGEVTAESVVNRRLVGGPGGVAGVEQLVAGFGAGVGGRDIAVQRGGQAPGDGHQAVLVVLAVAYLEGRAGRVEVAQFQAECFGQPQASAVEHPEQHRVGQCPV